MMVFLTFSIIHEFCCRFLIVRHKNPPVHQSSGIPIKFSEFFHFLGFEVYVLAVFSIHSRDLIIANAASYEDMLPGYQSEVCHGFFSRFVFILFCYVNFCIFQKFLFFYYYLSHKAKQIKT